MRSCLIVETMGTQTASVSIRARNAMETDALATAAFVMKPRMGSEFIKRTQGIEGFIIDSRGGELCSGDCHGLSIEHRVLQELGAEARYGKN